MLLAYHRDLIASLRTPTPDDPWRILISGCMAGLPCGVDGTDYGFGGALADLVALPTVQARAFCPEDVGLGTPRTTPDITGGDGVDVLEGRARVVDEHGADLTGGMIAGARAMAEFARRERVDLAILMDMSAACGSQVISDGSRFVEQRKYRKGVGVATAALLEAGIPVVSQRDHLTMALLRARLEPGFVVKEGLLDHHESAWVVEHLNDPHPRG